MRTIDIYTRGTSTFHQVKHNLDTFIEKAGLELKLNEITDVHAISAKNPKGIPYLTMEGSEPISMEHGEYVHTFCSRVRRWLVDALGYGTMTRIVVPTDFSDASLNALHYAIKRHKGSYTVIELVSAHMEVVGSINDLPVLDSYTLGLLNARMSKLVDDLINDEENEHLIITGKVIVGPIVESIIKESQKSDNTIIYIGSSGSSGLMKSLFGSVTKQLVKKTTAPLFIVPPDYTDAAMTKIAFAVSDAKKDAPLFQTLYKLLGTLKPALHLVHCQDDEDDFDYDDYRSLTEGFQAQIVKTILLTDRDVVSNITKHINSGRFHLLVMSHYQRSLLQSIFHRSISKQVVSGINCPILILNKKKEEATTRSDQYKEEEVS